MAAGMMYQATEESDVGDVLEEVLEEMTRQERCRHAVIAAMVAGQEVKGNIAAEDDDAAVA